MRTTAWLKGAATATALVILTGASSPNAGYDPLETFAPLDLSQAVNVYRSSNGMPGPQYWQNKADYQIHASLDPTAKTLTATMQITYTNNSPDTLGSLWLQIEQNLYKPESRGYMSFGGDDLAVIVLDDLGGGFRQCIHLRLCQILARKEHVLVQSHAVSFVLADR